MHVTLTIVAGPHAGQVFPLADRDTFLVGRTPDCHFQLSYDDPYFSRRHFLIEVNAPRCRVLDLNSRNGIRVNGQKVTTADLKDGDEVRAGQTVFRLSLPPDDVPTTAAWTPPAHLAEPMDLPRALPDIPGYVLEKELGRGGMGTVYRARRESDGTRVAIKTIQPALGVSERNVERFLREARVLSDLRHPNVVGYLDSGSAGDLAYIVMEYVAGPDAQRVVREWGPLPVRTAVKLIAQALTGLAYLHERGYVHRDVKPSNLLIGPHGDRKIVKVADFGLARAYEESKLSGLTLQGDIGGTPAFMAPEQITHLRDVGPGADQYAAAATLYYLLTGKTPYDLPKETDQALARILSEEPVPIADRNPGIPAAIAAAVHRSLNRSPEERFPDATSYARVLARSLT
jgi:serine/threonine-protein kinase